MDGDFFPALMMGFVLLALIGVLSAANGYSGLAVFLFSISGIGLWMLALIRFAL